MFPPTRIPVLGFAAHSGTGKTTLIKKLIPLLRERGLRLGVIKRSHHDFEIDHPGKDSYELHHAGSRHVVITSPYRYASVRESPVPREPDLLSTLELFDAGEIDLVLVEGFRQDSRLPCIELHRQALDKPPLFPNQDNIIAVASDSDLDTHLPRFELSQLDEICMFIQRWLRTQQSHPLRRSRAVEDY